MRYLKPIRRITAVILLLWGLLFYSHARAHTITFPPATKDVGPKMWLLLSYDDDDYDSSDDDYDDSTDYDDGGDDDGGDD